MDVCLVEGEKDGGDYPWRSRALLQEGVGVRRKGRSSQPLLYPWTHRIHAFSFFLAVNTLGLTSGCSEWEAGSAGLSLLPG